MSELIHFSQELLLIVILPHVVATHVDIQRVTGVMQIFTINILIFTRGCSSFILSFSAYLRAQTAAKRKYKYLLKGGIGKDPYANSCLYELGL